MMNMLRAFFILPVLLAGALSGGCTTDPATLKLGLQYQQPASGCGDIYLTISNAAHTEYLIVTVDRQTVVLDTATRTFDLATSPNGISVTVDRYAYAPSLPKYCNDVISASDPKPATWRAISGSVAITLSMNSVPSGNTYTATATLKNLVFQSPSADEKVTLTEQTLKDVVVGWYAG
jgi:hypothetical protein